MHDVTVSPDVGRRELPFLSDAEGVGVDSLRDVNALSHLVDVLQWSLDTVEDGAHNAWTELNGQRLAGSQDGITDSNARGILVYL